MGQWKIRRIILIVVAILFITILTSMGFSVYNLYNMKESTLKVLEENIRDNYDDYIKGEIDTAISLINILETKTKARGLPIEERKELIADVIRNIRYGEDGYFWMDTSKGDNVVLYGSGVEGTNRIDFQDTKGKFVVQEIIKKAIAGGGFIDYYFPREGEHNASPKRAYGAYFEPYDWIVGTGIYTDVVDLTIEAKNQEYSDVLEKNLIRNSMFLFVFFLIIILINLTIVKNIEEKENINIQLSTELEKEKEINYLSDHDQLTGLYNRRYFNKAVDKIIEEERFPLCIIIVDINSLKIANDAFGHLIGDRLIQTFSDVLKENFSEIGIISRIGGDEFTVLLPGIDSDMAKDKINATKEHLKKKRIMDIPVSAAFGAASYKDNTYSFATVFNLADERMYEEKFAENNKVKFRILKAIIKNNIKLFPGKKKEMNRVAYLAKVYGKVLGLDSKVLNRVRKSALVYDIGKVSIDREILDKEGELTDTEMAKIRTHTVTAYHILKNITNWEDTSDIVLKHHENFDGRGYPVGIKGEEIPFESRVLAIITDYVAMTSERPYRVKLSREEALKEIKSGSNLRYDPRMVGSFIKLIRQIEK